MSEDEDMREDGKNTQSVRLLIGGTAALGLAWAAWHFGAQDVLRGALTRAQASGAWGPVLFVALYIVAGVLLLPGSVLTLGAGASSEWSRGR